MLADLTESANENSYAQGCLAGAPCAGIQAAHDALGVAP
jgi:hypothetical protein